MSLLWAVPAHAGPIASLHAQMFPMPWDEAAITGMLAHPGSIAMVASQGGSVAVGGFALAQVAADEAEILTLGVAGEWRRHGVARRLVEAIKRAAARSGAASLFLEVAADNTAAQALYKATGFAESGRRKGYYERPNAPSQDAIVMRAKLVQT
ncbi:MAG: ribosomal protein S18-alanine N-acetyltransferase [Hyphomicrobiaceae bacterium]